VSDFGSLRERARELRRQGTDAEKRLWRLLRSRSMSPYKFRRQYVIGPFIADFCCLEKRLVIELDGGQHDEQMERDRERAEYMASFDFQTLRFWNDEVLCHPQEVLQQIYQVLNTIHRHMTERKKILYGWGRM
jgi:very-short-patch-repair endonuclease